MIRQDGKSSLSHWNKDKKIPSITSRRIQGLSQIWLFQLFNAQEQVKQEAENGDKNQNNYPGQPECFAVRLMGHDIINTHDR